MKKKWFLKINSISKNDGFTLIEAMLSVVILGITIAYSMPVLLYNKINIKQSQIKAGSLVVAGRIFDDIRSQKINTFPVSGITSITDPGILTSVGRSYSANILHCPEPTDICNSERHDFKIEVTFNGNKVYDVQGSYTENR